MRMIKDSGMIHLLCSLPSSPRRPVAPSLSLLLFLSFLLSVFIAGCSLKISEAEKKASIDEFFTLAKSCWPTDSNVASDAGGLKLAIESVVNSANATQIRLVAFARNEAVDFYLPIYRLSAGRWLINEKGRAYLLNEQCREFKLNDSKPSSSSASIFWGGGQIPEAGRIRLNPGQAFEVTLFFPPLPGQSRVGALVYDGRLLPFTQLTDAPRQ